MIHRKIAPKRWGGLALAALGGLLVTGLRAEEAAVLEAQAVIMRGKGNSRGAEKLLKRGLEIHPNDCRLLAALALLARDRGNYPDFVSYVDRHQRFCRGPGVSPEVFINTDFWNFDLGQALVTARTDLEEVENARRYYDGVNGYPPDIGVHRRVVSHTEAKFRLLPRHSGPPLGARLQHDEALRRDDPFVTPRSTLAEISTEKSFADSDGFDQSWGPFLAYKRVEQFFYQPSVASESDVDTTYLMGLKANFNPAPGQVFLSAMASYGFGETTEYSARMEGIVRAPIGVDFRAALAFEHRSLKSRHAVTERRPLEFFVNFRLSPRQSFAVGDRSVLRSDEGPSRTRLRMEVHTLLGQYSHQWSRRLRSESELGYRLSSRMKSMSSLEANSLLNFRFWIDDTRRLLNGAMDVVDPLDLYVGIDGDKFGLGGRLGLRARF